MTQQTDMVAEIQRVITWCKGKGQVIGTYPEATAHNLALYGVAKWLEEILEEAE